MSAPGGPAPGSLADVFRSVSGAGRFVFRRPVYAAGFTLLTVFFVLVFAVPLLAPYNPIATDPAHNRLPPSTTHWFGTDTAGRDVFSRVLYAPRVDLVIALCATSLALLIGIPLGLATGYFRGIGMDMILRAADLVQAFPVFILAMALVSLSGSSLQNIIYVIAFLHAPIYLRLTRSAVLSLADRPFVEAAVCAGNSESALLLRHILPNAVDETLVQASVNAGWCILLTAGLSFIGAGVREPTPEWGQMIANGFSDLVTGEWWISVFPGLALGAAAFSFSVAGDFLREYLGVSRE
jgi:peptide/nickel transport system permease protein